jgi:hypothetical protein
LFEYQEVVELLQEEVVGLLEQVAVAEADHLALEVEVVFRLPFQQLKIPKKL